MTTSRSEVARLIVVLDMVHQIRRADGGQADAGQRAYRGDDGPNPEVEHQWENACGTFCAAMNREIKAKGAEYGLFTGCQNDTNEPPVCPTPNSIMPFDVGWRKPSVCSRLTMK